MKNLLWLQSGGCGGCTMSLISAEDPSIFEALEMANINLLWHPALMLEQEISLFELLHSILSDEIRLDILCIEGAISTAAHGMYHRLAGSDKSMSEWVTQLSEKAGHVLAVGSCSSFGTIMGSNPTTKSVGLQFQGTTKKGLLGSDFESTSKMPVINIAGCPAHPDWILESLQLIASNMLDQQQIESYQRPKFYTDYLAHHGCTRNEYYEYKASAKKLGQNGCLMENLGCKATQARADCNIRLWNGKGSCLRAGYSCINCTAPDFDHSSHDYMHTQKLAGIPVGIPTDMPKAWFVALSSLSKAATPERLKKNATANVIIVEPQKISLPATEKQRHDD